MQQQTYILVPDLAAATEVPANGILSKTIQNDDRSKIIQFTFAPGQELSAHTAPFPATLYFVEGEASLLLGADSHEAAARTFVYMTPNLPHGIKAKTRVVMLLTMLKNPPPAAA
jgi:quercetin dioxygenase-like cupin family protein